MSDSTNSSQTSPLVLRDITVTYPDGPSRRTILDELSLEMSLGELLVIAGASGSGKSTLLAICGLLRRQDSGEVEIAGTKTSGMKESQRTQVRRDRIAIVYQSANLIPALTAIEQLELVGHIRGENHNEVSERARNLLEELDLADRATQQPAELSGGERQRVGIARALMAKPSILLADEPTASLDAERSEVVSSQLAKATRRQGLATLVVAHDESIKAYATRHLELFGGKLREPELAGSG